jgi:D-tyrosyl-tRNA(Tyr) deacylase
MRAVVQRVRSAEVEVDGAIVGRIGVGLLVYLGIGRGDGPKEQSLLVNKIAQLRIFENDAGKMDRSVVDVGGSLLVVSQFTLYGDVRRGRRPSFDGAMPPEAAEAAYLAWVDEARKLVPVEMGRFRAHMRVRSENDGPVTLLLDTDASTRIP